MRLDAVDFDAVDWAVVLCGFFMLLILIDTYVIVRA